MQSSHIMIFWKPMWKHGDTLIPSPISFKINYWIISLPLHNLKGFRQKKISLRVFEHSCKHRLLIFVEMILIFYLFEILKVSLKLENCIFSDHFLMFEVEINCIFLNMHATKIKCFSLESIFKYLILFSIVHSLWKCWDFFLLFSFSTVSFLK